MNTYILTVEFDAETEQAADDAVAEACHAIDEQPGAFVNHNTTLTKTSD